MINITQKTATQINPLEIERLLAERLILRILQPALQKQIEQSIKHDPEAAAFIFLYEGQMYLSLESIPQEEKRNEVYATIQRFQVDENANLSQIPSNLRGYLQTSKERRGRFIAAIALGAVLGVVLGLMGMAIGVLVLSMTGLTDSVAGIGITAVTFIACCTLGWFLATYYLWRIRPLNPWKH